MLDLIYNMPNFVLFIVISVLIVIISGGTTRLIHRRIPLKFRVEANQSITCISAFIGIVYAIVVGFIILYELNNYNKADEAENTEAKAMFAIFRSAHILPEPSSSKIRKLTIDYANNVINNEWPVMAKGLPVDKTGIKIVEAISTEVRSFTNLIGMSPTSLQALNIISLSTNALFDQHQERVSKIHSAITTNIWFVLILGSFLSIGINCLLAMELRLHVVCLIAMSLMVSAVLYLIVTLDRPYRGDFSIQPNTFKSTLEYINNR